MKVINCIPSRERCVEAGWFAYDLILDAPIDDTLVFGLKKFGALVYLTMLKKPFFKIENHNYMLKGIKGDLFFRVALHDEAIDVLGQIKDCINTMSNQIGQSTT